MVLVVILLLFGGYTLYKRADEIREKFASVRPPAPARVQDEDDLGGAAPLQGETNFGNNRDLFNN